MEGLLDRIGGDRPVIAFLVEAIQDMGYNWAYRVVNTAGVGLSISLFSLPFP